MNDFPASKGLSRRSVLSFQFVSSWETSASREMNDLVIQSTLSIQGWPDKTDFVHQKAGADKNDLKNLRHFVRNKASVWDFFTVYF